MTGWGRTLSLEPASWSSDNWPVAGVDPAGNGTRQPVAQHAKPILGGTVTLPASSDEFSSSTLGLQWLWNHNPDNTSWSLTARPGWMRLIAQPIATQDGIDGMGNAVTADSDDPIFAYNTLVQPAMGQNSVARASLDVSNMVDGQRAGLILFGQKWGWIGVMQSGSTRTIVANINGGVSTGPAMPASVILLEASFGTGSTMSFRYSLDGATFESLGGSLAVERTWEEGIKYGLFTYNANATGNGIADFDFFRLTQDGPTP
jgi:beta-xylosidase